MIILTRTTKYLSQGQPQDFLKKELGITQRFLGIGNHEAEEKDEEKVVLSNDYIGIVIRLSDTDTMEPLEDSGCLA